ncbi:MAG TPA: gamma-glutamylcyclotransferase family protein [Polyangiaceae bacterium]
MAAEILFVYGSLKRGQRHHAELQSGGARFLGEAWTEPGYALAAGPGDYVAMVRAAADSRVPGELFEVSAALLEALDAFEGDEYCRASVRVTETSENGPLRDSIAYVQKAR